MPRHSLRTAIALLCCLMSVRAFAQSGQAAIAGTVATADGARCRTRR